MGGLGDLLGKATDFLGLTDYGAQEEANKKNEERWQQALALLGLPTDTDPNTLFGLTNLGFGKAFGATKKMMPMISAGAEQSARALKSGFGSALKAAMAQTAAGESAIRSTGTQGLGAAIQNLKGRGLGSSSVLGSSLSGVNAGTNQALASLYLGAAGVQGNILGQKGLALSDLYQQTLAKRLNAQGMLAQLPIAQATALGNVGKWKLETILGRQDVASPKTPLADLAQFGASLGWQPFGKKK